MLRCSIFLLLASLAVLLADVTSEQDHSCQLPLNFICKSGECISKERQCDGRRDCHDNSDEVNCENSCEPPMWWRCNDGVCVSALFRCDSEANCPDASDEIHCHDDYKQDYLLSPVCEPDQFQCADGFCIPETWRCNGENECPDQSDEHACLNLTIHCDGFTCDDGNCIPSSWRCDGEKECPDGSDEKDCLPPIEECKLDTGFFACGDKKTCIHVVSVCDKKNDCPDASDEGGDCHVLEKNCLKKSCSHSCLQTPTGPKCTCPLGLKIFNETNCTDIDECQSSSRPCSHICVNTLGSYQCDCHEGYSLMKNNHSCRSLDEEPLMVFNTNNDVRAYYLEKEKYFSVSGRANQAVGVAFDGKYVYWTQLLKGSEGIIRSFLNGSNKEVIINNGISNPEDISIDWLTGNIYFTDSEYGHIAACSNDGLHCTVLISNIIQKPRAVAVHSNLGVLFWTDWSNPAYIGKAYMDGTNATQLITGDLKWVNGLCIDHQASRIYWVDGHFSKIESANFNGTDRKVALENVHHPYWVDIYEDTLYWSDWVTMAVQSCNKNTGKDRKTLVKANQVFGLQVYYPGRWNKTENHSCSHTKCQLCLLKGTDSYSCACPEGKQLARDGFSCLDTSHPVFLILTGGSLFITVDHQALGKHNVIVKDVPFLDISAVVYDNIKDRVIVYDEARRTIYMVEKYMQDKPLVKTLVDSDIGQIEDMAFDYRTNNLYWCDIYRGTIEVMNLDQRHRASLLQHNNGDVAMAMALVPKYGFMFVAYRTVDGFIHISKMGMDGKGVLILMENGFTGPSIKLHYDEETDQIFISDSGSSKIDVIHHSGMGHRLFRKLRKYPISITTQKRNLFWTNIQSTKLYWTDKIGLAEEPVTKKIAIDLPETPYAMHITTTTGDLYYKGHDCLNRPCSHVCVQSDTSQSEFPGYGNAKTKPNYRCLCPFGMVLSSDMLKCEPLAECRENNYLCVASNLCIDSSKRCNHVSDCDFDEDEIGCTGNTSCHHSQFKCNSGQCIDRESLCDKKSDCDDNSDEEHCEKDGKHCNSEQFACSSGLCLDKMFECDGFNNCPGGEDEENCQEKRCEESEFRCASSKCIPRNWECDHELDCDDGSDEHNKCGYKKPCSAQSFRCGNGRCIDMSLMCNGKDDCRDGTDEVHCVRKEDNETVGKSCDDDEYACYTNTSICLPFESRCNGNPECPKGEDEMGCHPCKDNQWECDWREHKKANSREHWHGQCIFKDWLCDGSHDCMDGSDEDKTMCEEFKKNPSSILKHNVEKPMETNCDRSYMCTTGECVDYRLLCNGEPNCIDGSDEGGLCETSCMNSKICSQICLKSPKGAICQCEPGYILSDDGKLCLPAPPPCLHSPCHQICQNGPNNTYTCLCYPGHQLKLDRHSCKAIGEPMTLLYAVNNEIRRFFPNETVSTVHKQSQSNDSITGMDVFTSKKAVFFSVKDLGQIHHVDLINKTETIVSNLGSPTAISIDWITENIYFVDLANNSSSKIRVCHVDKKTCATVYSTNKLIKALVVDPINKAMFYCTTKWLHDKPVSDVYKTNLDGTHVQHLLDNLNMKQCGDMTIDYDRKNLFVSDPEALSVWRLDYEGRTRSFFQTNSSTDFKPKNLQLFEDYLIVVSESGSKYLKHMLFGNETSTYKDIAILNGSVFLKIDQENKQRKVINLCSNVSCANLCVMGPHGPRCICPDGNSVEPNVTCGKSDEKQGIFSTSIMSSSKASSASGPSGKSVAAVLIFFCIGFIMFASFVYAKKFKQKKKLADSFRVHFISPSLSTIIAPLASIKAAAVKLARQDKNVINHEVTEYENPLHNDDWPKTIQGSEVEVIKQIEQRQLLQVPKYLVDSDSDAESDRDHHDGDFREKALLLP